MRTPFSLARPALAVVAGAALAVSAAAAARGEDWPRFRGPTGQGISADPNPPTAWSATENVAWKTPLPGSGWSSPVVWGDRVFVTAATEEGASCRVIALDRASGKVLWDVEALRQPTVRKENKNSWATPTPVTDGTHVYAWFGGGVAAVTFDGKVAWTNADHVFYSRHGLGASPILHGDLLIMPFDGSNPVPNAGGKPPPEEFIGWQKPWDKGFVLALDKATGKQRWKTMRGVPTRISHVTPLVIDVAGQKQLISPAGDHVMAFDPDTGERLWWAFSKGETPVPSVVFGGGLLFTTSGYEAPTIRAIRPGGRGERGDLTKTHVAWEDTKGVPMMPSFLYVESPGPLLFAIKENGIAFARSPADGKILWQERVVGTFSASPVLAAGKIYLLSEQGKATVLEAGPAYNVVAENEIGEPCQASPAFSDGQVFIRSDKHLYCIGQRRNAG